MMHPKLTPTENSLAEFWAEIAEQTVDWIKPWNKTLLGNFHQEQTQWFVDGVLNVSANCLDRHLPTKADKVAIIAEDDDPQNSRQYTFSQLHKEVCRMSNVLKNMGIKKGDRVAIYLPMIPEAAISMLACARIGAVHTVIFAGFSAQALSQRLEDSQSSCLISISGYFRGGKSYDLMPTLEKACDNLSLKKLLFLNPAINSFQSNNDIQWWHQLKHEVSENCIPEPMNANDPLFILYTSGSTGKPKGIVHNSGGYLVQAAYTHELIFDCQEEEVFWCTADVGWITGHSYGVYGPLCNGITTLMFSGIPNWPDSARNWQVIDKFQVNVFYTSPTAIRSLMKAGNEWLGSSKRDSLRLLGSVGEPINPEAWQWFYEQVGQKKCPIVDTWWQTETGAILLYPNTNRLHAKPGSAGTAIPGIVPVLLDDTFQEKNDESTEGLLGFKYSWPSLAQTILGDHSRFLKTYFRNGFYISGDAAKRDSDGDYWINGRLDDIINVSGHRLGTAEIESALASCPSVAESAIVGFPHDIKGQGIYAYVVLKNHQMQSNELNNTLISVVSERISPIAKPDVIRYVDELPKTRSGKVMRRILKLIASGNIEDLSQLGDLSTLNNPEILTKLLQHDD